MRAAIVSVVLAGAFAGSAAQGPIVPPKSTAPTKSQMRDTEQSIVVEGCIRGTRLKIDLQGASLTIRLLDASEFILEGPKETLQLLRSSHDGHQDEIAGTVIIPANRTEDTEIRSKQIGKRTRVTGGVSSPKTGIDGQTSSPTGAVFKPLRLKLGSLRHLSDKCSIPG